MIGLDTHVVLRILTGDDEAQLRIIRRMLVSHQDEMGMFFINHVVLAECVWALTVPTG
jgi:predicted nucleic-acid-binding protein